VVPGPDSGACQLKNDNLMRLGSVWYNIAQAGWVHWGWVMPRIRIATTALASAAASESEGDKLRFECHDQCQLSVGRGLSINRSSTQARQCIRYFVRGL